MTLNTVECHVLFDKIKINQGSGFLLHLLLNVNVRENVEKAWSFEEWKVGIWMLLTWGLAHWIYLPVHRVKKKKRNILLLLYIIVFVLSALNSGNDIKPYILAWETWTYCNCKKQKLLNMWCFRHENTRAVWRSSLNYLTLTPYSSHFTSITVNFISFYLFIQKNMSVQVSIVC